MRFTDSKMPLITCMVQASTPQEAIAMIRNAAFDGCDAYGFQYEVLQKEYRTRQNVEMIIRSMGAKPCYVTNYRVGLNQGMSDEVLAEGLLFLQQCGASLIDVMGDLYDPDPLQLTDDPVAIRKQRQLIDKIHENGGQVLMSTHTFRYMDADTVLHILKEQQDRGADVLKLVTGAKTQQQELENLRITNILRSELQKPFIFLSEGPYCKLHRMIGPMLGCCMWLTVQMHDLLSTKEQPVCRAVRQVIDHFDFCYPDNI